jgi:hypothetical protein
VFVENHGLLSGIDMVQYSINQPLKLCPNLMQMGGAFTMVQHTGLKFQAIYLNTSTAIQNIKHQA